MKLFKTAFVSAVVLLFFTVNLYSVSVKFLLGDVNLVRKGKTQKVSMNTSFKDGDLLITGDSAYIILTTKNGDQIKVKKNSKLLIDTKLLESGSISLVSGGINAKYNKVKKGSARKIYTPTAVAAIRGTEFDVAVSDSGNTRVDMAEGSLDVYNPSGKINISGKQKGNISTGKGPGKIKDSSSQEAWTKNENQKLSKNPKQAANGYKKHIKSIQKDSNMSKEIDSLNKSVNDVNSKSDAKNTEKEILETEENLLDNLMLNKASSKAIENVVQNYVDEDNRMKNEFEQLKKDLDKVREQQERDLEAIRKIKEKYLEKKQEIFDKHDDLVNQILNNTKNDQ